MGTNYYAVRTRPTCESPIHIGKSSIGWRFLFQSHDETWHDPPITWKSYDDVIGWLKKYTVDDPKYVIIDEYDEVFSLRDFEDFIQRKQSLESDEMFINCRNVDGYRFSDREFR